MYNRMSMITLLTVLLSATHLLVAAKPEHARFTQLPNATKPMPSASYSGYLDITKTKKIHYVFVESTNDPKTDPVLVWFNGGPGCSSLFGFLQEHGPFKMDDGKTELDENPYPWTRNASVLYLESPAGVGFSTVTKYEELFYSDTTVARDAMKAIRIWYEQFPEFGWNQQNNSLYITGESYGGLYVPYLTWHIYLNNIKAEVAETGFEKYNLKGFIVANGVTDVFSDWTQSMVENMYQFNLIPAQWYHTMMDNQCIGNAFAFPGQEPEICGKHWAKINNIFDKLNPYDLIRKNYQVNETDDEQANADYGTAILNGQEVTYKRGVYQDEYTPWLKYAAANDQTPTNSFFIQKRYKLFGSQPISDYFNNQTVRDALHIQTHDPWIQCNDTIFKNFTRQPEGSIWIYKALRHTNIRMLHFSGDTDGVVPTLGTKNWIRRLGWPVQEKWRAWFAGDAQVAGYIEKYDRLDFVTIKGVGHMSPQWARKQVTTMITRWIFDEKI